MVPGIQSETDSVINMVINDGSESPEKSWDLLTFYEKSWKSLGINEANVLEN